MHALRRLFPGFFSISYRDHALSHSPLIDLEFVAAFGLSILRKAFHRDSRHPVKVVDIRGVG